MSSARTNRPDPARSSPARLRWLIRRIDRQTLVGLARLLHTLRDPVVLVAIGIVQSWLMLR
jgi:hypothetical protein